MYSIYSPNYSPRPHEAVRDVAHMMGMLATLVGEGGTEHFNDGDNHGLSRLLIGLMNVLEEAADEVADATHDPKSEEFAAQEYLRGLAEGQKKLITKHNDIGADEGQDVEEAETAKVPGQSTSNEASYPKVPELSAKQQMIASTYRRGYDVKVIAKAVNLKAASVENMIQQLKEKGVLETPPESDELSQAVNS